MKLIVALVVLSVTKLSWAEEKCWKNGQSLGPDVNASEEIDRFEGSRLSPGLTGHLKCTKHNMPLIDMKYTNGKGTGKQYQYILNGDRMNKNVGRWRMYSYKNGVTDGLFKEYNDGKLDSEGNYVNGEEVWSKDYENGRLVSVDVTTADSRRRVVEFDEKGRFTRLECHKDFRIVPKIYKACGNPKKSVVRLYSSGKVHETLTFLRNEKLSEKRAGGTIRNYKDGKLHGMRTYVDDETKHKMTGKFKNGKPVGTHKTINDKGKTIAKTNYTKKGDKKVHTVYFLNGKKKRVEKYKTLKNKYVLSYHDNGKVEEKGRMKKCTSSYYGWTWSGWCPDGKHFFYYESGKKSQVLNFKDRTRSGTQKDYDKDGKLVTEIVYKNGYRKSRKRYEDGKKVEYEVFEKDGSRSTHKKYD